MKKGLILVIIGVIIFVLGSYKEQKREAYNIAPCIGKEEIKKDESGATLYKYTFYLHSYLTDYDEDMVAYSYTTEDFNSGKVKRYTNLHLNEDNEYEIDIIDNNYENSSRETINTIIQFVGGAIICIGMSCILWKIEVNE